MGKHKSLSDRELLNAGEEDEEYETKSENFNMYRGLASVSLLWKLQTLTCLDISKSNVSELPETLSDLAALQIFNASYNLLTYLPINIGNLQRLVKLTLPFNKISKLPLSFSQLKALEVLDLSHNKFDEPPESLEVGCKLIKHLNISHNQLQEWIYAPVCATALQYFSCAHNRLNNNPSWLWGDSCRSLKELDLSYNSFFSPAHINIPSNTTGHTGVTVQLKSLNLCNCGLNTNSMELLHGLKELQKLDLSNMKNADTTSVKRKEFCKSNFIWQLSFQPFLSKSLLKELFLCGVGLASLPDDVTCLSTLEILDCQENKLPWLPDGFSKLSRLRVAIFSNNCLLYLPKDFGELSSLEELWLDGNKLEDLPLSLSGLERLQWLDLYSNYFESIPSCLELLLKSLCGFDIDYNLFESTTAVNEKAGSSQNIYKTLKQQMRKHPQVGIARKISRLNGVTRSRENDEEQQSSHISGSYNGSESENESEYGSFHSVEESGSLAENFEIENNNDDEEDWDLDDDADDYFDPTFYLPPRLDRAVPKSTISIIYEKVLGPDSFCPSDIHPFPADKPRKDPFAPNDGQFEDA